MDVSCAFPTALTTPADIAVAESLGYARAWVYDTPQQSPDVWMTLALAAAQGLSEGTLELLLRQQAQQLGPEQPCPSCGRPCAVQPQPRPLTTRGGPLVRQEPVAHCPACRRDFFPPTPPLET